MSDSQKSKIAVSVIIPTYNASKVIVGALDSLVRQTINPDMVEVLVIDDCSPDNTIEIVKKYQKKLKHLRIYSTPENTGNPIAGRNIGIEKARGEYIHFLDHDDRLGDEALERLYTSATKWHSDVIYGKYAKGDDVIGGQTVFSNGDIEKADPFIHLDILEVLSPHKMFRRAFINQHKMFFDPEVTISEDVYFVMKAFINASVISVKGGYDYYYRVRRDDGGNLTRAQLLESPFTVYYASYKIIKAIQESSVAERYKIQWMKLYTERFLQGRAREILDSQTDIFRLDVVYDYVVHLVGDEVLSRLNPEFKLLVKLVELRNSPERHVFLKKLTATTEKTLQLIDGRVYFIPSEREIYDASLLYRRLAYTISSFDVANGYLVMTASISLVLNRRENLTCMIKLTNTANKYVLYSEGKKVAPGEYRFRIDIRNALSIANSLAATYTASLELQCGDVSVKRQLFRNDITRYTESVICPAGEKYQYRNRCLDDDSLVAVFERDKYSALRNLKYRISRTVKR